MQSIDEMVNKFYAIRVKGVSTHLENAPYTFSTANFPLLFIRNFKFNLGFGGNFLNGLTLSSGEAQIVIVVEAFKQGTSVQNYAKSRELISNLADALNNSGLRIDSRGIEIREDFELTGDTVLFVVVADVSFYL
jgi:hypothetical protein